MAPIVREMDAALFLSRCEGGTNLVAMECMACGVPTVLSANTGHLDLVGSGVCIPLETQRRSEEHTSELQSLMRISYAVFCLKKKKQNTQHNHRARTRSN